MQSFTLRGSYGTGPLLLLSMALLSLGGCVSATGGQPVGTGQAPQIQADLLVSAEWLAARLQDANVLVLHVASDRNEYERGHIPGAQFLPIAAIVAERDGNINELPPVAQLDSVFESVGVSDGVRVVVYGAPLAAARTFFTLDYLGHGDRTALLNGGLEGWRATRRPLSMETPSIARGSFTPRPIQDRVVDAEWIRRRLDDPALALLDARPEAQYSGEEPGAGVARGGHIPGAGSLFWERTVRSEQNPTLLGPEALRTMFREAGVAPDDTVVAYCRTGMQASFAYFVARYLGYETRMYDGSFLDWSRRADLPVER